MTIHLLADARHTDTSARLISAVRDLASSRSMDDVAEVVRHAARDLVAADGATFVLRDGPHCFYVEEDAIEPLWRGQRFPLEACISGWAMLNRQAVAIDDIYLDARIPHEAYRPTFVKSLVMTPVRVTDPVAAIGTYWADNHIATLDELMVLQALADSTAVAIENVRLLTTLEERVRERTAELAAANRDLKAFAHIAAHDLRNPLMTAGAHIELALRSDRENLSADALESLNDAQDAHQRMADLIGAILDYSVAANTDITLERVDLGLVAARAVAGLHAAIEERHATVTIDPTMPFVAGHAALLERAVQNLVANAINYGDPDAPQVTVSAVTLGDRVVLTVSDNGAGVPMQERATIFDAFKRGSAGRKTEGFGIGLAFVARLVEKLGGSVSVGDSPAGGAAFAVTLPAADPAP